MQVIGAVSSALSIQHRDYLTNVQCMLQLTMLVLAMMLSCGCLTPRRMEGAEQMGQYDQYGVYGPVALATPILDEEVVYDDA